MGCLGPDVATLIREVGVASHPLLRSARRLRQSGAMFGPVRSFFSIRPHAAVGILTAMAAVTLLFTSTPFLIAPVAERYGVSEGLAGTISVAQVGAFALANFVLPRLFAPSGRVLRRAAVGLLILNVVSALPNQYWLLIVLRVLAGATAGAITWVAWADAMRQPRSLAEVATIGPVIAALGAPLMSFVAERGDRAVYLALALATVPAVLIGVSTIESMAVRRAGVSRSRSNRVLLGAMFLLTLGGAGLFVFEAVVGREVYGLEPGMISIAFSLNAVAGLAGVRLAKHHRRPGWFLLSAGPAAALTAMGWSPILFFAGMAWWGFAFWMGLPGVLHMLSDRSLRPDERAGDAQGIMAMGRALGPLVGGSFVNAEAFAFLGVVAGSSLALSGALVIGVQEGREHLPPTDSRVVSRE